VPIVLKSGSLNLLEPSGPVKVWNGIALPLPLPLPDFKQLTNLIDGHTKSTYITNHFAPTPNKPDVKIYKIADGKLNAVEVTESFKFKKFFEITAVNNNGGAIDNPAMDVGSYTLFIAENKRHECPRLLIKVLEKEIFALIDTGCELSIMNEHLCNRLGKKDLKCFELPTQHVNLLSAFNKKSHRVKK
jgi:hypothetical protein